MDRFILPKSLRTFMFAATTCLCLGAYAQDETPAEPEPVESILKEREESDSLSLQNPFSISQYRFNYILPISHVKDPNPIGVTELDVENVDNFEAKYQISVKLPIYLNDENPVSYTHLTLPTT